MISYEVAKKKALEYQSTVNRVTEYESAWLFYNSKARGNECEDDGCAVDKETGEVMTVAEYMYRAIETDENPNPIKKFKIDSYPALDVKENKSVNIIHDEDPYIPDRIGENGPLALTRKNARFIEAVVKLDSNYGKDDEYNPPSLGYEPEENASNANGLYCGSTKYWFEEMQKGTDFKRCVLGAVIAIDTINSTHLEACENGRKIMRDRICTLCNDCDELKEKLKEKFDPLNKQGLIYALTESMKVKSKEENRKNLSFATKFCSYASLYLSVGTEYPKYDDVVSRALPQYAQIYLGNDKLKIGDFKVNSDKEKDCSDEEKLQNRLSIYKKYSETIKEIISSVPDEKLTIDEFDHIVWYGLKGK